MPRRKRKHPQRTAKYKYEYSSSDQSSLTDKRPCIDQVNKSEVRVKINSDNNSSSDQYNTMNNSIQQGFQYTGPMTSSPNVCFQPSSHFLSYPPPPVTNTQLPPNSPGIETLLKELCNRMERVEVKLNTLEKIETRLDKMDSKYSKMDSEIAVCM